jgi:hypothetical protein
MTPVAAFDDPRHRQSEELVFEADRHVRAGRLDEARRAYAQAAVPELELARGLTDPKLRGLFASSALTCFLRARAWDDAARAAHAFLAEPDLLDSDGVDTLLSLLDDALRSRDLFAMIGDDGDAAPLELRLDGGRVRRGIAPSSLVQEREEIAQALVYRVADFKAGRKFRKAGPSAFMAKLALYEAPARAGSYGIRFFVASVGQTSVPGTDVSPTQAVEALLELARVAAEDGPEGIREAVPDTAYATAFIRAFRDLAPDGTAVATVSFSSPLSLYGREVARFSSSSRRALSRALVDPQAPDSFSVIGTLKAVSLRGKRRIVLVADDGGTHTIRLRGAEHDDTIGPKLNRRVEVTGTKRTTDDGTVVRVADDIVLVEDEGVDVGAAG